VRKDLMLFPEGCRAVRRDLGNFTRPNETGSFPYFSLRPSLDDALGRVCVGTRTAQAPLEAEKNSMLH
jgi:hypothetical protein